MVTRRRLLGGMLCLPWLPSLLRKSASTSAGCLWGTWVKPGTQEAIAAQERLVGRRFAVDHQYYDWGETPGDHERWTASQGRIPFVALGSKRNPPDLTWAAIAAGRHDDYLRAFLSPLAELGRVVCSFYHEPEVKPALGEPADFAAAFRHFAAVRDAVAPNVELSMVLLRGTFAGPALPHWYPGDIYVDIIGADGYNGPHDWRTFRYLFTAANDFAVSRGKLCWVAEVGCIEDPDDPTRKAGWLRRMSDTAKAWPALEAIVYFHGGTGAWDIDSSPQALDAYRRVGCDPYFGGC